MNINRNTIQVSGVSKSDYPDFSDAYVTYAEYNNGEPIPESELENIVLTTEDILNSIS
jgi:hypothetical protein